MVVDGESSDPVEVSSGVPQGTVLGPLMFLMYINDIGQNLDSNTTIKLFADDALLFRNIETPNDQTALQKDLDTVVEWSNTWQMSFNPSKCSTMFMTRSKTPLHTSYNMMGQKLEVVEHHPYLGVEINKDLNWGKHITNATNSASKTLGFLKRNMSKCDPTVKTAAYKTLVRPKLEYAASVWDPHQAKFITKLEKIQRRAARFVMGDHRRDSSVTTMLNTLEWPTLQARRRVSRLCLFYKAVHQIAAITIPAYVLSTPRTGRDGRTYLRYIPIFCRTNVYKFSYIPRTIIDWNSLSMDTVNQTTVKAFKTAAEGLTPVSPAV